MSLPTQPIAWFRDSEVPISSSEKAMVQRNAKWSPALHLLL